MRVVVIDDDRLVAASQILKQEPDAKILKGLCLRLRRFWAARLYFTTGIHD